MWAAFEPAAAADWWPEGWYDRRAEGGPGFYPDIEKMELPFYWDTAEPLKVLSIGFIRFYQTYLSRFRKGDCPFHPSCSRYGLRAIHDYGWVWGWLMIVDRIFYREGGNIYSDYPKVRIHGEMRPYNPPRYDYIWADPLWPLVVPSSEEEW